MSAGDSGHPRLAFDERDQASKKPLPFLTAVSPAARRR
jgi:hypothetical protein